MSSTVQLVVNQVFIDLYEQDPIKLTYSVEDITNTETKSVFSRQFRVPATTHNFGFFSTAFEINGMDFDVTQNFDAFILDDGALIVKGKFRLTKIYRSEATHKVDYECLFLGETRSFGSTLGDHMIAALDFTEYTHTLPMLTVIDSWQAFPEGGLNDGLFNGDIIYPLVDFGNTYAADGTPNLTDISGKPVGAGGSEPHFTENGNGLPANRFKPMMRAKVVWDKVFSNAGFTYSSEFIDSDFFRTLYISAWGADARTTTLTESAGTWRANRVESTGNLGIQLFPEFAFGAGLGFDLTTGIYTVPTSINGIPVPAVSTFTFGYSISGAFRGDEFVGAQITGRLVHVSGGITTYYDVEVYETPDNGSTNFYFGASGIDIIVSAGDQVYVEIIETAGGVDQFVANTGYFTLNSAIDGVQMVNQFKDDYKQIDFIKDILTKFRLVMAPDRLVEDNFIIEPWKDYIATGNYFDWTKKVDLNKDWVLEPLFFTQAEEIDFSDREDKDYLNQLNQLEFSEIYGTLKYDSLNELLKGKREVRTTMPPTPVTQLDKGKYSNGTTFIIPQIWVTEPGSNEDYPRQKVPMNPHTRLLFYNGLQPTNLENGGPHPWYDELNNQYYDFPMVSYFENFPNTINDVNLNWQAETGYIVPYTGFDPLACQSAYDEYWSQYIESLYSKWGRRVTVYIELTANDLREFTFDDLIFIKDTYYYVEKITDVPIGQDALVKVDLIKIERAVNIDITIPPDPPSEEPWNEAPENYNEEDDVWQIR